jgi:hypothetical protein
MTTARSHSMTTFSSRVKQLVDISTIASHNSFAAHALPHNVPAGVGHSWIALAECDSDSTAILEHSSASTPIRRGK